MLLIKQKSTDKSSGSAVLSEPTIRLHGQPFYTNTKSMNESFVGV